MARRRLAVIIAFAGIGAAAACADIVGIVDVPDGAVADSSSSDVADAGNSDAAMCDPLAPFTSPAETVSIPPDVANVSLSADELTAFFCRITSSETVSLTYAKRSDTSKSFIGQEVAVATDNRVCVATMGRDNLTYIWTQVDPYDASPNPPIHLFIGKRANASQAFNMLGGTPLTGLNDAAEVYPYLPPDGTQLYFLEVAGTSQTAMQSAADSGFSTSTLLPGLPKSGLLGFVVTSDGLVVYYGIGGYIKMATRASTVDNFPYASNAVTQPVGTYNIRPVLITDDRCKLYYILDRDTVMGDGSVATTTTMYVATKTP